MWWEEKCRAEENKGTLAKTAGSGGGFGKRAAEGRTSIAQNF